MYGRSWVTVDGDNAFCPGDAAEVLNGARYTKGSVYFRTHARAGLADLELIVSIACSHCGAGSAHCRAEHAGEDEETPEIFPAAHAQAAGKNYACIG